MGEIEGAHNKRFFSNKRLGKKTTNFFPDLPNMNDYFNKLNMGLDEQRKNLGIT
jgi:hypothetical protein